MKKKTFRALGLDNKRDLPNPANLASRLRRMRDEMHLMLASIDAGLERIEATREPRDPAAAPIDE